MVQSFAPCIAGPSGLHHPPCVAVQSQAVLDWEAQQAEMKAGQRAQQQQHANGAADGAEADGVAGARFVAYVPLPDQRAIEQMVLDKKKSDLLAKYTSEGLRKEQDEAKELLNVRR